MVRYWRTHATPDDQQRFDVAKHADLSDLRAVRVANSGFVPDEGVLSVAGIMKEQGLGPYAAAMQYYEKGTSQASG